MKTLLALTLLTLLFISCNQKREINNKHDVIKIKTDKKIKQDTILNDLRIKNKINKVYVEYWKNVDADEYYFNYSDDTLYISSLNSSMNKKISDRFIVNKFLTYVDVFFISKTQKIEISRKKRKQAVIAHYSRFKFKGYFNDKEVFNKTMSYGEEQYKVKYNVEFIKLYELLNELLPPPSWVKK